MQLEKASTGLIKEINSTLAPKLNKDPLFMFFCPILSKRQDFINAYFNYYIYEWSRYDELLYDEKSKSLISLVDPATFEYKFKGKGAHSMKKFKTSSNVFAHRENLEEIFEILVSPTRECRVMTLYANCDTDFDSIVMLVDEAMEIAQKNNYILMFETFSRKLISFFEAKGFSVASQKQFLNTQFIETVMTYNI